MGAFEDHIRADPQTKRRAEHVQVIRRAHHEVVSTTPGQATLELRTVGKEPRAWEVAAQNADGIGDVAAGDQYAVDIADGFEVAAADAPRRL